MAIRRLVEGRRPPHRATAGQKCRSPRQQGGGLPGDQNLYSVLRMKRAVLAYFGEFRAMVLGERVFTTLRNGVVHGVTHLPLSIVEAAGTGDLLGRTTHDATVWPALCSAASRASSSPR